MSQVIEIKGVSYPLRFGYGALRELGNLWNLNGPEEVGEKIGKAFSFSGESLKLGFKQMDVVAAMVYSAIVAADPENPPEINLNDCADAVMGNPTGFLNVIEAWGNALPKPQNMGKPEGVKKTKRPKK